MTHNIDAIVFVFISAEGGYKALYADDAKALIGRNDFEHVSTLEPRAWIEAHYGDVLRIEVLEREHQEFFERWHGGTIGAQRDIDTQTGSLHRRSEMRNDWR